MKEYDILQEVAQIVSVADNLQDFAPILDLNWLNAPAGITVRELTIEQGFQVGLYYAAETLSYNTIKQTIDNTASTNTIWKFLLLIACTGITGVYMHSLLAKMGMDVANNKYDISECFDLLLEWGFAPPGIENHVSDHVVNTYGLTSTEANHIIMLSVYLSTAWKRRKDFSDRSES